MTAGSSVDRSGKIAKLNGGDGIRLEAGNSANRLPGNVARSNAPHDCHDSSTGTGTAGTDNVWVVRCNIRGTQNRNGLSYFAVTAPPAHPASR